MVVACGGDNKYIDQTSDSDKPMDFRTSFVVELEEGDKVFSPRVRRVEGSRGEITLKNELDAPHGFRVPQLGITRIVNANSSLSLTLQNLESGEYTIDCQLHSAHRHGKLILENS